MIHIKKNIFEIKNHVTKTSYKMQLKYFFRIIETRNFKIFNNFLYVLHSLLLFFFLDFVASLSLPFFIKFLHEIDIIFFHTMKYLMQVGNEKTCCAYPMRWNASWRSSGSTRAQYEICFKPFTRSEPTNQQTPRDFTLKIMIVLNRSLNGRNVIVWTKG